MAGPKPYEFIGFGAMAGPKPYEFILQNTLEKVGGFAPHLFH